MKRILFVCHGNICRSPMAEFVMKDLVAKAGREADFYIESAATSTEESGNCLPLTYLRALAQYDRTFQPTEWSDLRLFAQGGWCDGTDHHVPYSRMFDLGGSWGSPFYFGSSLLTARPNEFTANLFALFSLRVSTTQPLWKRWDEVWKVGSNPRPFAGIGAAWGLLWRQNGDGRCRQGIDMQAPNRGLGEAVAGINGLMRWGLVDLGVALAYRITPPSAYYHFSQKKDNTTLLITAAIAIQ